MGEWYYGIDGAQRGPVDDDEMRAMLASGMINQNALVWKDGMEGWLPLAQVPEWASVLTTPSVTPVQGYEPPTSSPPSSGQPGYGPRGYVPLPAKRTNGLAIASLVCGVMSLLLMFSCALGILAGIPAVVCGHMALSQIKRANSPLSGVGLPMDGNGLAVGGLITGYLSIVATLGMVVVFGVAIASDMS